MGYALTYYSAATGKRRTGSGSNEPLPARALPGEVIHARRVDAPGEVWVTEEGHQPCEPSKWAQGWRDKARELAEKWDTRLDPDRAARLAAAEVNVLPEYREAFVDEYVSQARSHIVLSHEDMAAYREARRVAAIDIALPERPHWELGIGPSMADRDAFRAKVERINNG